MLQAHRVPSPGTKYLLESPLEAGVTDWVIVHNFEIGEGGVPKHNPCPETSGKVSR